MLPLYEFPGSNPAGRWVILSYANGFPPQTYAAMLRQTAAEYRVAAMHMRPLWEPPPPPDSLHNWRQFADDLLENLAKLTHDPVIGIGHSVGAVTMLYAAIKQPQRFRKLVLIDPTLLPTPALLGIRFAYLIGREARIPLVQQALRRGRRWPDAEAAYQYFRGKKLFARAGDAIVRAYTESITTAHPEGGLTLAYAPEWEAQIFKTIATDVWRLPARLTVPTLILRGEHSTVFYERSAARFKRLNPAVEMLTIPGVGHLVGQEAPDHAGREIARFLAQ